MEGRLAIRFDLKKIVAESHSEALFLVGWTNNDGVLEILNGIAVRQFDDESGGISWVSELKYLAEYLPHGLLQVVGVCGSWPSEKYNLHLANSATGSSDDQGNLFPVADDLIVVQVGDDGDVKYQYYRGTDMSIVAISQDAVDEPCSPSTSLKADTVSCRVTMKIKLNFSFSPQDVSTTCKSLGSEFSRLFTELTSNRPAFFIGSTLVTRNGDESCTVDGLCPRAASSKSSSESSITAKYTHSLSMPNNNDHVPVIATDACVGKRVNLSCTLDAMLLVPRAMQTSHLHVSCTSALVAQLSVLVSRMATSIKDGSPLQTYTPLHFCLPHTAHHTVTIIYPSHQLNGHGQIAEESLADLRHELHLRFNLPLNRPLLRRHMHMGASAQTSRYLTNVHAGLNLSSTIGGTVSLVQGVYAYHHYMQDHFNDDGWGCAYRSLQTLWSWFNLQGYTPLPVPTHKEIQQTLVDVEDKPVKFVGSRQWIGSIEVQTVLNQCLQVESRIQYVMNGAAMPSNAREIARHFQQQGTPIMIGGGTLAHTILGVDFNDRTGDVRFLILDPHYTGGEDLGLIQNKGWCGWKGATFWDQHAHYNMCMPLRPNVI